MKYVLDASIVEFQAQCGFAIAVEVDSMNALDQAAELVTKMTAAEKAQLLQLVAGELGDAHSGVESRPDICGGEPCIARNRIPIWVLEQSRRLGASEADLLRSYPTLRAAGLVSAWAYVRQHPTEIDDEITANENA